MQHWGATLPNTCKRHSSITAAVSAQRNCSIDFTPILQLPLQPSTPHTRPPGKRADLRHTHRSAGVPSCWPSFQTGLQRLSRGRPALLSAARRSLGDLGAQSTRAATAAPRLLQGVCGKHGSQLRRCSGSCMTAFLHVCMHRCVQGRPHDVYGPCTPLDLHLVLMARAALSQANAQGSPHSAASQRLRAP